MRFCSFAPAGGASPSFSFQKTARGAARGISEHLRGLALEGLAEMALRGIAFRRKRHYVLLVVQFHGPHVGVDPGQHVTRALRRRRAHLREERMLHRASKSHAHVISDARLAGGVNDPRRKLRHKDPRLQAHAALQAHEVRRFQELLQGIEHVEVHHAGHPQPRLARQPGILGG